MKRFSLSYGKAFACVLAFSVPFGSFAYSEEYLKEVQELYATSLGIRPEREPLKEIKFESLSELYRNIVGENPFKRPALDVHQLADLAFKAADDVRDEYDLASLTVVKKMELINGLGEKRGAHIAQRISTIIDAKGEISPLIQTEGGKVSLVRQLTKPHTNVEILRKKQNTIKALVADDELRKQLVTLLAQVASGEERFLLYYDVFHVIPALFAKGLYWSFPIVNDLNDSASGLEAGVRIQNALNIVGLFGVDYAVLKGLKSVAGSWSNIGPMIANGFRNNPGATSAGLGICVAYSAFVKSLVIAGVKLHKDMVESLHTQLIGAATVVNNAKKAYALLEKNSGVAGNTEFLAALRPLVHPSKAHSKEFNELVELLGTSTFEGEATIFSLSGRVLRAHLLMTKESVRKEFTDMVRAIGELDVYVALASKIKSTEGKEVRYCFADFDVTSDKPYIKATGMWNPFVSESRAVTNDFELGGMQPRVMMLSGPNTGGKSTFGKAGMLNSVLVQTFGIAAAKSWNATLFGNMDCYLNMTDDTASGVSGLQAEVNRAKDLLERIKNKPNDFSFVLPDEIFTATSPDQAELLAASFIERLSSFEKCVVIGCTHFDKVIELVEGSTFGKNWHMEAITDTEGKVLKYTYKLAAGRSHVKNAHQVAKESMIVW